MPSTRLNSTKKIDNDNFKLKLGTTNKLNPFAVYIEGRTFISPNEDKDDYAHDLSDMKRYLKTTISENIKKSNLFENRVIVDFQAAASGIAINKKSFISFTFVMKQPQDRILSLKDLKTSSEGMINAIVNDFGEYIKEKNYVISKTKK